MSFNPHTSFFKTIFNTATEGWLITDEHGNIIMTNPRLLKMFGYQGLELIGKKVEILIPEKTRNAHIHQRENYFSKPRKRPHGIGIEVLGLRKDNSKFHVEISLNYINYENSLFALAVITDISIRKNNEKLLQQSLVEREIIKTEKLYYELEALKSQLNPHYLFNCLSILSPLINIDVEKSRLFTNKLINSYRYILETQGESKVKLNKELQFLDDYFFLQKVRFNEKFIINYNIANEDRDKFILPFSLQLLVENVFKHNALYINKKIEIIIRSENNGITVENSIISKIDSKGDSFGIGLKNIEKRYRIITNSKPVYSKTRNKFSAWVPFVEINQEVMT